ncbi:hypothetical protein [Rahnella laticis]|uniref:hypothetical protein n=1 Tax=Rahnella laticis TaxID=2787622 RepID=UPI0018A30D6D|nr:hypothetical protein [Rahnella laticis]MBF7993936.1 hypothetical protein [Rahnella laticis]
MEITDKNLIDAGFTLNEVSVIKRAAATENTETAVTYEFILKDLSKRFWGGVICYGISFIPILLILISRTPAGDSVIINIIVMVFIWFVTYYIIPMKLAVKAKRYLRKYGIQ